MNRLFLLNAENISTIRGTLIHKEIQCYMYIFDLFVHLAVVLADLSTYKR